MKKFKMRSLLVLVLISAFALVSNAQSARVQLTAGGETKALTRTLAPNSNVVITFKADAGQTISFTAGYDFNENDLYAYLLKDNEQLKSSKAKAPNEFLATKSGDYQVVVENKTNKRVTTTIYLDLFNPEDMQDDGGSDPQTEALNFEGSDMASVNKSIPANGTMKFTFDGTKGVTTIVNVADRTNKLTVVWNENENQKADTTIALNKDVSRKLTRTGMYTIEVINETAKSVPFELQVSIAVPGASMPESLVESVRFGAGKSDAQVKRSIGANGSIEFTFNARKGQRLTYSINYDINSKGLNREDLRVEFKEPGSGEYADSGFADEPNEHTIKTGGSHRIKVTNTTGRKLSFEFGIAID
jgi:hypothetical protein